MFQVLENNRPAEFPKSPHKEWHNSKFISLKEAQEYAEKWVNDKCPFKNGLRVGEKWYISDTDFVEIIEVS